MCRQLPWEAALLCIGGPLETPRGPTVWTPGVLRSAPTKWGGSLRCLLGGSSPLFAPQAQPDKLPNCPR